MFGTDEIVADETPIDRAARAMSAGASRRSVLRGVAAGLLATAGGGIASNALAKKKRKGKRKGKGKGTDTPPKNPPQPTPRTCQPGTSIDFLSVPADGSEVFTSVLEDGVDYVLRPTGFWSVSNDRLHDAFASFTFADPFSPRLFDNGVRTGLLLDGELPDIWGPYKPNHSYGIVVIGKGKRIAFRMLDSDYSGNSGVIHVEVLCAVQAED